MEISRRGFIGRMLAGIATAAVADKVVAEPKLEVAKPEVVEPAAEMRRDDGFYVSTCYSSVGLCISAPGANRVGDGNRPHILAYSRYLK